jgi:hypothetical protein
MFPVWDLCSGGVCWFFYTFKNKKLLPELPQYPEKKAVRFGKQKLCSKHAMVMSNMQCVTQRLRALLLTICSELAGLYAPTIHFHGED